MNESLNDRVIHVMCKLQELKESLEGVNDLGEETGFVDDEQQIRSDFGAHVESIRIRIARLQHRIKLHREGAK